MIEPSDGLYVTQPDLPPLDDLIPLLEEIWASRQLTNAGPFHERFELALAEYLDVPFVSLFCNATIGLITSLQSLRITGEVITTPYSFAATAHSLLWNGVKPVFVDIRPDTLNIDSDRIAAAITPQTTAIMPVHCYGTPCEVDGIQEIADIYGLKVIYDAAHAFGVRISGRNLLGYGDLSVMSFHATKVFNTFEGGAVVSLDRRMKERIDRLKNFGFVDEVTVVAPGINGKMSEFQAALGVLQLGRVDTAIARRSEVDARYRTALSGIEGIEMLSHGHALHSNFAYFPIFVSTGYGLSRDELYDELRQHGIYSRRYFYPLISDFPMYRGLPSADRANLPVAAAAADMVLCLPIYPALTELEQARVIEVIVSKKGAV